MIIHLRDVLFFLGGVAFLLGVLFIASTRS